MGGRNLIAILDVECNFLRFAHIQPIDALIGHGHALVAALGVSIPVLLAALSFLDADARIFDGNVEQLRRVLFHLYAQVFGTIAGAKAV